MREDEVQDCED